MIRHVSLRLGLYAGALFITTLVSASARAQTVPDCANLGIDPAGTPVVYLAGSTAVKPVLKELSTTFVGLSSPIRIIYAAPASCAGLSDVVTPTPVTGTASYWDASKTETNCNLPTTGGGQIVDIGLSDVYPTTCDGVTIPSNFKDFHGPIQVMNFVVPPSSRENAISSEAALIVYGFGGNGTVINPWNLNAVIFQRPDTSGTRRMIGKAIGLDSGKWRGNPNLNGTNGTNGSTDMLNSVAGAESTNPNEAIGTLASDVADSNRAGTSPVKILAFQPKGQTCAYYPDSTSSTSNFDKRNVRENKYPIWGPVHLVTKVDGTTGAPAKAEVATIINYFTSTGLSTADKQKVIDAEIGAHTIPACAMKVQRSTEVSVSDTATPFTPDEPCGCYYEFKANGAAPSSCTACADDSPCGGGKCRYNYCEAK